MTVYTPVNPAIIPSIVGVLIIIPELVLLWTKYARTQAAVVEDRSSLAYLWGVIIASIIVAIPVGYVHFPEALFFELSKTGLIFTLAILLVGMALRGWAIVTLGTLFSVNVTVHQDHSLVSTGPYALIRHPSYAGLLLEFLAFSLTFQHLLSLMIIMLPTILVVLRRIYIEERVLEQVLGAEYRDYQHRTSCLIPYLL